MRRGCEPNQDVSGIRSHPVENRRQNTKKTARSWWGIVEREISRRIETARIAQNQCCESTGRVVVDSIRVCPRLVGVRPGWRTHIVGGTVLAHDAVAVYVLISTSCGQSSRNV